MTDAQDNAGPTPPIDQLLTDSRAGSSDALGRLLDCHRPYLLLVANETLASDVRAKIGASDLVQDTFVQAQRDFRQFRGHTEEAFKGWLRAILLHRMQDATRRFRGTGKRDLGKELSLDDSRWQKRTDHLADVNQSPSSVVSAREQDHALQAALARLPEHYRQVIGWRTIDRVSFEEIGRRLDRSPEAARKLWSRAVNQLAEWLCHE